MVKEGAQAHTGITEGTFFRDEKLVFLFDGPLAGSGRIRTTRLLDIKLSPTLAARTLMWARPSILGSGTRCCARRPGYYAYRRMHSQSMSPGSYCLLPLRTALSRGRCALRTIESISGDPGVERAQVHAMESSAAARGRWNGWTNFRRTQHGRHDGEHPDFRPARIPGMISEGAPACWAPKSARDFFQHEDVLAQTQTRRSRGLLLFSSPRRLSPGL